MTHPSGPAGTSPRRPEDVDRGVPTWSSDLRRLVLCAAGLTIAATLLLLLAATGLMRHEVTKAPIAADGAWAGILAAGSGLAWAFLPISSSRPDHGFRRQGLPALLLVGVALATTLNVAAICTWHLAIGDRAASDAGVMSMTSNPIALATVTCFVLGMHAWSAVCALGFVRGGAGTALAAIALLLALVFAGFWQGWAIFDSPPTALSLVVWWVVAGAGLCVMLAIAALGALRRA